MEIINSILEDSEAIFRLYEEAVAYQKKNFSKHWQPFDMIIVAREIKEKRQWKIIDSNNCILCIFATSYNDPEIWEEKDKEPSIYLHRIVSSPLFRGMNFVKDIIEWAKIFGKTNNRKFIRLDTWADNEKLISYYKNCGFAFVGITTPTNTTSLPKHYNGISLSLFEIDIEQTDI